MTSNLTRSLAAAAVILAAALSARGARPAAAAPAGQANLLTNGGMESFGSNGVAAGWEPWWEDTDNPGTGSLDYADPPNFIQEGNPTFVHSGGLSQHIGRNWDPWHGGIRQTFSVPAGASVRLTGYARVFASTPDFPSPSDAAVQTRMRIGAEPDGSVLWYSNTVRWSGTANPHGAWAALTVDVTAGASGRVTVFLSGNFKGDSRYHLDAWWDDVTATVISTGGTTANTPAPGQTSAPQPTTGSQPQPTSAGPAATAFQTPTPGADGNIIYVVQPGDTLWRISAITGVSVDQLRALNGLTSDIISVGQRLIIGTSGAASPTATVEPTADASAPTSDANAAATSAPGAETTATGEGQPPATPVAAATEAMLTGTVCALLYNDANGNGVRDSAEGLLAGGQVTVVDIATGAPVQSYTTDGVNEPHCFADLPVGQYTISSAPPGAYHPTTVTSTPLEVSAGSTSALEFGAQPSAEAAERPAPGEGNDNQALLTALLFAGGIVFLLLAAGVGGFLFLRRPK
ncbi:MAG: LysM peptidoglycan-binding domain-containing protein [Anaerolineales bacterium]|nr:LysM peptidoglycan-binding domain-containing protein [Anaerolineales bacterium]